MLEIYNFFKSVCVDQHIILLCWWLIKELYTKIIFKMKFLSKIKNNKPMHIKTTPQKTHMLII